MLEAIRNRRSVRFYRDTPVSDADIDEILKAGFCAPTGHNERAWHVIVVRDQAVKNTIAGLHQWSKILARAPVVLVVCVDTTNQELWVEDGSTFLENVMIQATEMGYGTCWVMTKEEKTGILHDALNLPEHIAVVGATPVGTAARYPGPHDPKLPEGRVHRDRFTETGG